VFDSLKKGEGEVKKRTLKKSKRLLLANRIISSEECFNSPKAEIVSEMEKE